MNKWETFINNFFHSNDTWWRLVRTIFQGVASVFIEYRFEIVEALGLPEWCRGAIVLLFMSIMSPIMSEIGKANAERLTEIK